MPSKRQILAARQRVLETIPKGRRSFDTLLTKILRPLFVRLPREVQLRLVKDTMADITAACLIAREQLGDAGNVRVDGNECQIGLVTEAGDFEILARGASWEAAWDAFGDWRL
jgi:hypothetical protein